MKKNGFIIARIVAVSFFFSIIIGALSVFQKLNDSNIKIKNLSNDKSLAQGKIGDQQNDSNIRCGYGTGLGQI